MCSNVIGLDRHQCKRCANAGFCATPNGDKMCVEGDWNGPKNDQQCIMYEYGNDYANLSLIDPQQPYFIDTHRRWNWEAPIRQYHDFPQPIDEGLSLFHHGSYLNHKHHPNM